jgi:hypothetical protein
MNPAIPAICEDEWLDTVISTLSFALPASTSSVVTHLRRSATVLAIMTLNR